MHLHKDGDFYTVRKGYIPVGDKPKEQVVKTPLGLTVYEMEAIAATCNDPVANFFRTAVVYLVLRCFESLNGGACYASISHTLIPLINEILRKYGRKSDLIDTNGYHGFNVCVERLKRAGLVVRSSMSRRNIGGHVVTRCVFQTVHSSLGSVARLDYSIADACSAGNDSEYSRRTTEKDVSSFFEKKRPDKESRVFSIVGENKKFIRKAPRRKNGSTSKIARYMVNFIVDYKSDRIEFFKTTLVPKASVLEATSNRVESYSGPPPPRCRVINSEKFLSKLVVRKKEVRIIRFEEEAAGDVVSVAELDGSGGSCSSGVIVPKAGYCGDVTTRTTVHVGYWDRTLMLCKGDFDSPEIVESPREVYNKNPYLSIELDECRKSKVDLRSTNNRESSCLNLNVAPLPGPGIFMNSRGVDCLSMEGKSDLEKALIGAMLFNAFTGKPLLKSFFSKCLGGSSESFETISRWIAGIDKHNEDMSDVAFREIDELRKYAKVPDFCACLWKDLRQVGVRPQLRLIIHMLNEEKLFGGKSNFFASNVRKLLEKIKKDPEAFLEGVGWARYLSKDEFDFHHARARRREKWEKHNGKGREVRRLCVLMFASVIKKIQNRLWSYRIEVNKHGAIAKRRLEGEVLKLCRKDPIVAVNLYHRPMKYLLYLVENCPDLGGTREETYFALNFKECLFDVKQRRYFSSETFKEIVDINKAYCLGLSSEELSSIIYSSLGR